MTIATRGHADRAIEWLFAIMMVVWGVYLLLPMATFEMEIYRTLAAIADERVWGIWSMCVGLIRLIALAINGYIRQTPAVRMFAAGLGVIWWSVLAYLFLVMLEDDPPAAASWYPVFIMAELYSVLRSAGDAFVSGAFRRRADVRMAQ